MFEGLLKISNCYILKLMYYSNYILILLIVDIVLSFFFGFIILIINKGWKKIVNVRFFTFAVSAVLWQITNLIMFINTHLPYDLLWTRLTYLTGIFAAYYLLRFIIVFPKINIQNQVLIRIVDIFGLVITLIGGFITLLPDTIISVTYLNGSRSPQYGFLFTFFTVALVVLALSIFLLALINYLRSDKTEKIKMKYMIIGVVITLLVVIFTDIISPSFVGSNYLSNFDAFSLIFLFIFTFYAIVKHQLFNIKVILTETAVGLVVLVSLIQTLLANNTIQRIISGSIFILVVYGGYLIIKSVLNEIHQKEQLQELTIQLGQANAHLKDLDKMKTEFVSLASHELLTPTSAIEGYLSMVLDEKLVKVDDPKLAQYLDRVYRSAKRLARLIADMLNISRIEEGRLLVEKKDVDLTELIRQVLEELKFKADEHKQKMEFKVIGDRLQGIGGENADETSLTPQTSNLKTTFMTFADPDKVKEILVNIIGNAIKYTLQPGTIHITIEKVPTAKVNEDWGKIESVIKSSTVDDQESIHAVADEHMKQILGDQQYLIKVKDEGVGIPKEELTKLFKKFHRVGNFSTQESQGTGLGLYITRALVELHHGRVWPDSEGMGKGSTFSFSLPVYDTKQAIIDLEAQSPQTKEQLKPLAKTMGDDEQL